MAGMLLSLLAAATDIETSQTYKVLTDADNMGGSCTSRLAQVNKLIAEVQQLIQAATDSIDTILKFSTSSIVSSSKKNERLRLLLLAQRFFGTKYSSVTLQVSDKTSQTNLKTLRENFNKVSKQIDKQDMGWRFSCDDTWTKKVETLQTEYGSYPRGERISAVAGLNGKIGTTTITYAFFDLGGPTMRPIDDCMDENEKVEAQISWYINRNRGWFEAGPCTGIQKAGEALSVPYAATLSQQKLIYFCPKLWEDVGSSLKEDLTTLKGATISTADDNLQHLDLYMSPGATLLHEMTHQVFDSVDDALGYNFKNVEKGENHPLLALENADSYNFFAVAAYLSQVEWHTGVARPIGYKSK
ncbi:hypothetical protein N7495_000730 [Penicillium taxi]|uniref:uncharacterized protein n=1 Tax=Penicillium taxi TaxID=168475 RepID=UPI0025459CDB|nr:uncharacterized protein N7495_000730 [Penicillium taxi]KAJ5908048.1 hypothetical protein N7495_000730 [Penicillium taxi]